MAEIAESMNRYRECCRTLWNVFMRPVAAEIGWDAVDVFRTISSELFSCLVATPAGISVTLHDDQCAQSYICIIPKLSQTPIRIHRETGETMHYWDDPIDRVDTHEIKLEFIEFFDWDELSARDFRYFRVVIREFAGHDHYAGREALIEVENADVELFKE